MQLDNNTRLIVREKPRFYIELQHDRGIHSKHIDNNQIKQAISYLIADAKVRDFEEGSPCLHHHILHFMRNCEGVKGKTFSFRITQQLNQNYCQNLFYKNGYIPMLGKRRNEHLKILSLYQVHSPEAGHPLRGETLKSFRTVFTDITVILGWRVEKEKDRNKGNFDHFWIHLPTHPLNYKPPKHEIIDKKTGENKKQKNFRRNKIKRWNKQTKKPKIKSHIFHGVVNYGKYPSHLFPLLLWNHFTSCPFLVGIRKM